MASTMPVRGVPATRTAPPDAAARPAASAAAAPMQQAPAMQQPTTPQPASMMPGTSTSGVAASSRPATQPVDAGPAVTWPVVVERFDRAGPMRGVVARVNVADPRVSVRVSLADPRDPDGSGPAVGRLQTVAQAAREQGLSVAMNASFFEISGSRTTLGKRVGYFVGNGAWPIGWHAANGTVVSTPADDRFRAAVIVHQDRRVSLEADVRRLPDDAAFVVSGNAKVLSDGIATVNGPDLLRHPRSAVGLSEDGKTLLLVAIDGRREGWSVGATLGELATVMKSLGATDAINLDGGGSSDLVVRDAVTGVYAVANRPSERAALTPSVDSVERPVVDLIGVEVSDR